MQVLKEEIKEEIKRAAKEEFLKLGFAKTSMVNIAKNAGISASNIYNYFPSKSLLFDSLVSHLEPMLQNLFSKLMDREDHTTFQTANSLNYFAEYLSCSLMETLWRERTEFLILFDCGMGTRYVNAKESCVCFLEEHFQKDFKRIPDIHPFITHILANNLIEGILEIFRHYDTEEDVRKLINNLVKHHVVGVAQFVDHQ